MRAKGSRFANFPIFVNGILLQKARSRLKDSGHFVRLMQEAFVTGLECTCFVLECLYQKQLRKQKTLMCYFRFSQGFVLTPFSLSRRRPISLIFFLSCQKQESCFGMVKPYTLTHGLTLCQPTMTATFFDTNFSKISF